VILIAPPNGAQLGAMGLSFAENHDISWFLETLRLRFEHSIEKPNNWLRALRNILRFRQTALCLKNLEKDDVYSIASNVVKIAEIEARSGNFERKFQNALWSILFLLKRRRYDPNFLSLDEPLTGRSRQVVDQAARRAKGPLIREAANLILEVIDQRASRRVLVQLSQIEASS